VQKVLCLLAVAMWFVPLTGTARAADHVVIAQSNESLIWAPLYIARKLGYFQDEGIDIDVVVVKSGPAALTAVNAGSAQMALGFPATPIEAVGKGFKLKIIAELSNQFIAELMMRKDVADKLRINDRTSIAQRIKALRGLTIATNGTGSANDYLLERIIRDAGLKPDVDVTITPIGGGSTILAAFDQHRIDGFVATPPTNAVAAHDHGATQLIDFAAGQYKPIAGIIYIGLVAQDSWLKANPQVAARTVKALSRALALMRSDPGKAKAAVQSFFTDTEPALFDAAWSSQLASFPKTARLNPADISITMNFIAAMSETPVHVDPAQVFTNDYVTLSEKLKN
jgi:NitT/TauT family transport system substrate-binding protein